MNEEKDMIIQFKGFLLLLLDLLEHGDIERAIKRIKEILKMIDRE